MKESRDELPAEFQIKPGGILEGIAEEILEDTRQRPMEEPMKNPR